MLISKVSDRIIELSNLLYLLIIISLLNVSPASVSAEIYTYERDGIIVISSEPPPKRLRPTRRGSHRSTKKTRNRRKRKRDRVSRSSQRKRDSSRPQIERHRASKAPSKRGESTQSRRSVPRWRPAPRLRRGQADLLSAAQRYQLPPHLLWSVLTACHDQDPARPKRLSTTLSSCLSRDVRSWLDHEETLQVTHDTSKESAAEVTRDLMGMASLLRRLINHFRGDVTLTITAYPTASQQLTHPVFLKRERALSTHKLLSTYSRSQVGIKVQSRELSEDEASQRQKERATQLKFIRFALKLYRRLSEERS